MFKLLFLPVRLAFLFLRLAGIRGVLLLAVGVAIGMLLAPKRGAQLRAELQAKLAQQGIGTAPVTTTQAVTPPADDLVR